MPAQQLPSRASGIMKKANLDGGNATIPFNPSSQHLMDKAGQKNQLNEFDSLYLGSGLRRGKGGSSPNHISRSQWISVAILFFVNLINYMDRLTIAGILPKIQNDYNISDSEGGALQTAFVCSYMIFAPIFGYLGDRHSRKLIMAFGVFLWTVFTIIGSFMPNYSWFLICRAMVGIGEASYSTIAPTIISDMFVKDNRSKMLALFYFAIPVGSGLGYIVGAKTTDLADGDWRWGLRVTPILGLVAVFFILFAMTDPPRGESEGHGDLKPTTYTQDLRSLSRNRSFVLSTAAFTCVAFCTGALSWWGPKFIEVAVISSMENDIPSMSLQHVSLIFGAVTMLSGIVGVPLGSILSTKLKAKYPRADPIICAVGLLSSALFLGLGIWMAAYNIYLAFVVLFIGEVTLNLNWSIVADILLYVVVPTRRSTAEAVQILISHMFGDAGSPYLIGVVSDALRRDLNRTVTCSEIDSALVDETIPTLTQYTEYANKTRCDFEVDYISMQYSLLINNAVEILGGILFIVTAFYIIRDKMKCDRYVAAHSTPPPTNGSSAPETKLMLDSYPKEVYSAASSGESESSISTEDDEDVPPQLQLIPEQA